MGAHTEWGGYVIDYRKVRNYNCPDLKDTRVRTGISPSFLCQDRAVDKKSARWGALRLNHLKT